MKNNNFDISLKQLKNEAEKLSKTLDNISNDIKKVEEFFNELNINIDFSLALTSLKEDNKTNKAHYLRWQKDPESFRYRLFFTTTLFEKRDNHIEMTEEVAVPFIQTNLKTRVTYYKFLGVFIDEFTNYLEEFHGSLLKTLENNETGQKTLSLIKTSYVPAKE